MLSLLSLGKELKYSNWPRLYKLETPLSYCIVFPDLTSVLKRILLSSRVKVFGLSHLNKRGGFPHGFEQHFLLFPQCFLPYERQKSLF